MKPTQKEIAALKAQLAAQGWQPIADAPRDGYILITGEDISRAIIVFAHDADYWMSKAPTKFTHYKLITPPEK